MLRKKNGIGIRNPNPALKLRIPDNIRKTGGFWIAIPDLYLIILNRILTAFLTKLS